MGMREVIRHFLKKQEETVWFSFDVDEWTVHLRLDRGSTVTQRLEEARHRGEPLGGRYSAQLHSPHTPTGQQHLHIYTKNDKLLAINRDGTAHDQSHGVTIPNKVADAIRQKFPEFSLPANNFIESLSEGEL